MCIEEKLYIIPMYIDLVGSAWEVKKKNSLQNIHKKPLNKMKIYCETEENAHKKSQFVLWKMVFEEEEKKMCKSTLPFYFWLEITIQHSRT